MSGGVYIGQNTLRDASVEFVRKPRTNYARRITQPFQTRTQPRGSRLRACQNDYFDTLKETPKGVSFFAADARQVRPELLPIRPLWRQMRTPSGSGRQMRAVFWGLVPILAQVIVGIKKVGKKAKKELTNGGADGNIAERSREGSTSDASPERKTSKNLEKSS